VSDAGEAWWQGDLGQPPAALEGALFELGGAGRDLHRKGRECVPHLIGQPISRRGDEDRQVGGAHLEGRCWISRGGLLEHMRFSSRCQLAADCPRPRDEASEAELVGWLVGWLDGLVWSGLVWFG